MTRFAYRAKDGPSKTVDGELDAENRAAAVAALDAMGLSPVWVRETEAQSRPAVRGFGRIRARDVTVFTRQLASLTRSGVPILRALSTIREQTLNRLFSRTVADMSDTIRDGGMLSDALEKYPRLFPNLYRSMVRAGESAGILDNSLYRLAEAREQEEDTRRKVQAAMAYPVLVVVVGVATVFLLLAFFLPRVVELFEGYKQLPLPTRLLISTSNFFSANWYWMVLILLLCVVVFRRLVAIDRGKTFVDSIKLRIPFVRGFIQHNDIARFARTLALLTDAGIPIDQGLMLSAETLGNAVIREEIKAARESTVQQGMSLSSGLGDSRHVPRFVVNMTAVGEEAGRLDQALLEVAGFYEKEVEQQTRMATSLIEPILILIVGGVVAFIVTAMLLPIFEMSTSLR